jgi:MoaA/NifB/PqqE/SkfB family radical SAM enzyme
MIEYMPWSSDSQNTYLEKYKMGKYSILEVELGGGCNLSCKYCDSPDRKIKPDVNLDLVEMILNKFNYEWLFICGMGEPFVKPNYNIMLNILSICEKTNTKCSIFTNGIGIDSKIKSYIKKGILSVIVKLDSLKAEKSKEIFRSKDDIDSTKIIRDIKKGVIYTNANYTNIAASIVPTIYNQDEIVDIVNWCLKNNIYPMIGDLEESGDAKEIFTDLSVSISKKRLIKNEIKEIIGEEYNLPICPSVIGGIKLSYNNYIIVDELTGLSCSWFWLTEAKLRKIIRVKNINDFIGGMKQVTKYRTNRIESTKKLVRSTQQGSFGGCGGDISIILNSFIEAHTIHCKI